jgi:hypothetical protein
LGRYFDKRYKDRSRGSNAPGGTAAIFGQLAGAFYGAEAIPESWLERLAMREFITEMADSLGSLSENQ